MAIPMHVRQEQVNDALEPLFALMGVRRENFPEDSEIVFKPSGPGSLGTIRFEVLVEVVPVQQSQSIKAVSE